MDKDQLIAKLNELRAKIPEIKAKGVGNRDDGTFKKWHKDIVRFLRIAGENAVQEVEDVEHLWFKTAAWGGNGYSREDSEAYLRDLDTVDGSLDAAIENLNLGLVPRKPEPEKGPSRKASHSVVVHNAGTVVAGEHNMVNIINSLTISDVLKRLDVEIEKSVVDPDEKKGLRAQVDALARHPAFAPILTVGLKAVLGL